MFCQLNCNNRVRQFSRPTFQIPAHLNSTSCRLSSARRQRFGSMEKKRIKARANKKREIREMLWNGKSSFVMFTRAILKCNLDSRWARPNKVEGVKTDEQERKSESVKIYQHKKYLHCKQEITQIQLTSFFSHILAEKSENCCVWSSLAQKKAARAPKSRNFSHSYTKRW